MAEKAIHENSIGAHARCRGLTTDADRWTCRPAGQTAATETLEAKPGERVRIYLVNAGPNEFSGFHPIAGIWDKVYPSGNPKNALTAMQNYTVAPGDAAAFDIISPVEGANALVNHSMKAALSGAIAVLMFSKKADPSMGHGDKILVR